MRVRRGLGVPTIWQMFIELRVQSMKKTSSEHVYWTMSNLSSYCGFVDVRIKASDGDLPVLWVPVFKSSWTNWTKILFIHLVWWNILPLGRIQNHYMKQTDILIEYFLLPAQYLASQGHLAKGHHFCVWEHLAIT